MTPSSEGPELLGEILARLFVARGWGRRNARRQLEDAWQAAVGPEHAGSTRVLLLRSGVLEIEVNSPVIQHELAHFRKRQLLKCLEGKTPSPVKELRFRTASW